MLAEEGLPCSDSECSTRELSENGASVAEPGMDRTAANFIDHLLALPDGEAMPTSTSHARVRGWVEL